MHCDTTFMKVLNDNMIMLWWSEYSDEVKKMIRADTGYPHKLQISILVACISLFVHIHFHIGGMYIPVCTLFTQNKNM